jgi:hypothetical protein
MEKSVLVLEASKSGWKASESLKGSHPQAVALEEGNSERLYCVEITPLQYKVLPPYGLITEAFIPLGAFLLLVGIFTSAVNVSQDGELRRDFRKSAIAQLNLLRTIGIAQLEKELIKNFKSK